MEKDYSEGSVLLMILLALGLVVTSVSATLYLVYNQPGIMPQVTTKTLETRLGESSKEDQKETAPWNQALEKEVVPTSTPLPTPTPSPQPTLTPKPSPTPKPAEAVKTEVEKDLTITATALSLTAEGTEGGVRLNWSVTGNSPKGFKVIKSTLAHPEYPTRSGDTAQYLPSPDIRTYTWSGLTSGTTYHFRVGVYNGSGISLYSNDVEVAAK